MISFVNLIFFYGLFWIAEEQKARSRQAANRKHERAWSRIFASVYDFSADLSGYTTSDRIAIGAPSALTEIPLRSGRKHLDDDTSP